MYNALVIDEILRHVFSFLAEDAVSSLAAAARCCRTWKEPALDRLWWSLTSVHPLLHLIPGIQFRDGRYVVTASDQAGNLTRIDYYSQRVKHIKYDRHVALDSSVISILSDWHMPPCAGLLPSLRTAKFSLIAFPILHKQLGLSPCLTSINLDLGFKTVDVAYNLRLGDIAEYLEEVRRVATDLQVVSIRGMLSQRLTDAVASMRHVRILSVRTGYSLTSQALLSFAHFPFLEELELHAAHLRLDDLRDLRSNQSATFPVLRTLRVRASSSALIPLLEAMSSRDLALLWVEIEDHEVDSISWQSIFAVLVDKAHDTLRNLTIEHHIELDDEDLYSEDDVNHDMQTTPNPRMTFNDFKVLAKLKLIQNLTFDMTLPPIMNDEDIDKLTSWWPELIHLDLASGSSGMQIGEPAITLGSLFCFAQNCPKLVSLVLPLDVSRGSLDRSLGSDVCQRSLRALTVSDLPGRDLLSFVPSLRCLFPSLVELHNLRE